MREIRWTERSEDHIARHDVEPIEVEQVIYTRPRLVTDGRGQTTLVFGTTDAGRHLVVVLADAEDGRHFRRDGTGHVRERATGLHPPLAMSLERSGWTRRSWRSTTTGLT